MISSLLAEVTGSWFLLTPSELLGLSFLSSHICSHSELEKNESILERDNIWLVANTTFLFRPVAKHFLCARSIVEIQETGIRI